MFLIEVSQIWLIFCFAFALSLFCCYLCVFERNFIIFSHSNTAVTTTTAVDAGNFIHPIFFLYSTYFWYCCSTYSILNIQWILREQRTTILPHRVKLSGFSKVKIWFFSQQNSRNLHPFLSPTHHTPTNETERLLNSWEDDKRDFDNLV